MAQKKKGTKKVTRPSSSSSKFAFWIIGLIAIAIIGFIFLANNQKSDDTAKEEIDYANQPFLGEESAPVSIVEFGDYKCPNCKNFADNVVPLVVKEFVDTGKAKFYYFHYPFINVDSERTAKFSEAVYHELGNDKFWEFHELIYDKQPEDTRYEKVDVFTEDFLTETLEEIANKEEVNKVVAYFDTKAPEDAWKSDEALGGKLGVSGTPTVFVNGKRFDGQTMEDLNKLVEEAAKEKGNE
ncbi:protein-disulfide isomerase [Neobacillus niacini]|uniref:DsbA family protein n=1 Tax=Neobacillus niacini TaxID=86668 RepID=UPI0028632B5B|nr:DsbA family protein [Neobacillus niacini]MDR7079156.1 protein-disulfide isomerase [Neobacillus niacini]